MVVLFASLFFKFVICKSNDHEHRYVSANMHHGSNEIVDNSVNKIKKLFGREEKQQPGGGDNDNKLYEEDF